MAVSVFIVDDMKKLAESLATVLCMSDVEVETFYDAKSALSRAMVRLPDILITDIEMPGMDGISLAQAITRLNPHCKILLMSGNQSHSQERWKDSWPADSFAFIQKPFPLRQLRPMVDCFVREQATTFHK